MARYTGTSPSVCTPAVAPEPSTSCAFTVTWRWGRSDTWPRIINSSPGCRMPARYAWLNHTAVMVPLSSRTRARTMRNRRLRVGTTAIDSSTTRMVASSPSVSPAMGRAAS